MTSAQLQELDALVEPLRAAMPAGLARLVARPNAVVVDRPGGTALAAIGWSAELHQRSLALVDEGVRLADGIVARRVGDLLVLRRPPDARQRVEELVRLARLSSLAGRFLNASLAVGRNLVIIGGGLAGEELAAALLAEGQRPVVVAEAMTAVPQVWPVLGSWADAAAVGADRAGAWQVDPAALVDLLVAGRGVVACSPDERLDRALMRYELAAEARHPRGASPLFVLAGIDVAVVVGSDGRVSALAGIELAEDGYRPRLLFATGLPPVPTALVPVGLPVFLDELAAAGHQVLAEELNHAVAAIGPGPAHAPPEDNVPEAAPPRSATPARIAPLSGAPRPSAAVVEPPVPRFDPTLVDAPPPGWELDQLGESVVAEELQGTAGAESATLAATFGLGPPPAPPGVTPFAADGLSSESSGFAEALRRARERDAELTAAETEPTDEDR